MSARKPWRSLLLGGIGTFAGAGTVILASTQGSAVVATGQPTTIPRATPSDNGLGTFFESPSPTPQANTPSDQASAPSQTKPAQTKSAPPTQQQGVTGTFQGDVSASNPYGPIQVQIAVRNGKIIDARLIQMPPDFTSRSISTQAAGYLREEVLMAQSANITMIGGASLTSPAYIESLASAISKAGI
jgi:uncharacterized protein with FMN-binding domain